jgi:lysophospholipase L1-like esterase
MNWRARPLLAPIARLALATAAIVLALVVEEGILHYAYGSSKAVRPPFGASVAPGDDSAPRSDPRPVCRILSLGDSIGHSYGLDDPSAGYPHVLEHALNARDSDHRYEVFVSGQYSPSGDATLIRNWLRDVRPTWVVQEIELSNDTSDEALVSWDQTDEDGLPRGLRGGRYLEAWDGVMLTSVTNGHWYEHTRVYTLGVRVWGWALGRWRPNPIFGPGTDTYFYNLGFDQAFLTQDALDAGFDRMFLALQRIDALCRQHGVRFLVVILPSRYAFTNGPFRAGADRLLARAQRKVQEIGIQSVEPRAAMDAAGGARLFQDFCHPTAAGHAVIARAIEETMLASAAASELRQN